MSLRSGIPAELRAWAREPLLPADSAALLNAAAARIDQLAADNAELRALDALAAEWQIGAYVVSRDEALAHVRQSLKRAP